MYDFDLLFMLMLNSYSFGRLRAFIAAFFGRFLMGLLGFWLGFNAQIYWAVKGRPFGNYSTTVSSVIITAPCPITMIFLRVSSISRTIYSVWTTACCHPLPAIWYSSSF